MEYAQDLGKKIKKQMLSHEEVIFNFPTDFIADHGLGHVMSGFLTTTVLLCCKSKYKCPNSRQKKTALKFVVLIVTIRPTKNREDFGSDYFLYGGVNRNLIGPSSQNFQEK